MTRWRTPLACALFAALLVCSACAPRDETGPAAEPPGSHWISVDVPGSGARRLAQVAGGWRGEVIAGVDQSYAGWDVEIGDADNDGRNEILVTGCPDSRLDLFERRGNSWTHAVLADNLARARPGMGLAVKIADLDGDGCNEIALGTGQEDLVPARLYLFRLLGAKLDVLAECQPGFLGSWYTHNLAIADLTGDRRCEILSAYCGAGEIVRYDVGKDLRSLAPRQVEQLPGSGEESMFGDVDGDGRVEYIAVSGFREDQAAVHVYKIAPGGELVCPPWVVLNEVEGKRCFYASVAVGDLDNDGRNELVVGWKRLKKKRWGTTLVAYRIGPEVTRVTTLARNDASLDSGFFEKMMCIGDADNDGKNELVVSTRGGSDTGQEAEAGIGCVYLYRVERSGAVSRTTLADFVPELAESSWIAVGDADGDGRNEVVVATGRGDRRLPGTSYLVELEAE